MALVLISNRSLPRNWPSLAAWAGAMAATNRLPILNVTARSNSARFTKAEKWKRKNDRAGVVFVMNGIVAAHQEYLALGGRGFLLGDGGLNYGHEKIFEAFYTAHLWRGFFASFDIQHINNPGYNKDRGPVVVPGLRFHVDF